MKIAVIGAGAMGSIYGGILSRKNEVYLIDTNETLVEEIRRNGLRLQEGETENRYFPKAAVSAEKIGTADLVILFVKALFSRAALKANKALIGPDTYVMTLQNGSGHEEVLEEFVPKERMIIGTTEDNGAVLGLAYVRRGGAGNTNVGMLAEDGEGFLPRLKESFEACGFHVRIHGNIQQLIWNKLFTNVSLSAVTGVLQAEIGYVYRNPHAWNMALSLLHEAVQVAHAIGIQADEEMLAEKIKEVSVQSPHGITSICADIRGGRLTEVDTISGSVVRAAKKAGIPVPVHEFVVNMIHGLEEREKSDG